MNIREWTLPFYTILTQLAVGSLFVLWVIRIYGNNKIGWEEMDRIIRIPILIILVTAVIGIIGAHFHLSRPFLSYLAISNYHTSWLSRELVFNLLFILASGIIWALAWFTKGHNQINTFLGWAGIFFGLATDYCMSRIYQLSSQPAWNSPLTTISFFAATILLGVVTIPELLVMDLIFSKNRQNDNKDMRSQIIHGSLNWLIFISIGMVIVTIGLNYFQIISLQNGNISAQTSLKLLLDLYFPLFVGRFAFLFIGVGWLVFIGIASTHGRDAPEDLSTPVFMACLLVLIAEILGRFLFYAIHVRVVI
jgi:anaerobic dimethyl sulfoxide reductase subunit C (anchor subunit)